MWIKRELELDEENGDNDIDAGDNETSLSHDIKIDIDDAEEDLAPKSKLQPYKSKVIILPFTLYIFLCILTPLSISTVYSLSGCVTDKYVNVTV